VSELVGSVFVGLADVITDGITFARLRSGDIPAPNEGYKAAYTTILCVGIVTTALSLAYRLRNARLVRAHVLELSMQGRTVSVSEARRQAQQHKYELAQTHRTKVVASLALLSIAAQGKATVQSATHIGMRHPMLLAAYDRATVHCAAYTVTMQRAECMLHHARCNIHTAA
jgi:hypothetical protein